MIDIQSVKEYLQIDIADSSFDNFIQTCIKSTFTEIENYCRQPIIEAEMTKYLRIYDNQAIFTNFPITAISAIEIYDSQLRFIKGLETSEYRLLKPSSIYHLIFDNSLYHNFFAKVTYSCGYTDIPMDIQKVNIEMAALMFKESDARGGLKGGRLGLQSNSENLNQISSSITYKSPIQNWNNTLNKYRAPFE